jgi:hypothetical protein
MAKRVELDRVLDTLRGFGVDPAQFEAALLGKAVPAEDPTGRFDILLSRIIERVVLLSRDPVLIGYHRRNRELIEHCFEQWFGPLAMERRLKGGRRVHARR